jgi:hypothetical protein
VFGGPPKIDPKTGKPIEDEIDPKTGKPLKTAESADLRYDENGELITDPSEIDATEILDVNGEPVRPEALALLEAAIESDDLDGIARIIGLDSPGSEPLRLTVAQEDFLVYRAVEADVLPQVGTTIVSREEVLTSWNRDVMQSHVEHELDSDAQIVDILIPRGARFSEVRNGSEDEILLPRGSRFLVTAPDKLTLL